MDEHTFHWIDRDGCRMTFHAVDAPSGRVMFCGPVPTALVTDDMEVARALRQCGGTIAGRLAERKGARYVTSYATFDEAKAAVAALGAGPNASSSPYASTGPYGGR